MAKQNSQWETLGQNIQDIIDQAINSHDYQALNQTIRQAVSTGAEAVRRAVSAVEMPNGSAVKKNLPVLYGNPNGQKAKGIAKIAGGSVISCGAFAVMLMRTMVGGMPTLSLAGFAWGVWMICSGINGVGKVDRFKVYRKALGDKTQVSLEKLARIVGKNVKFVRKEVVQMIEEGLFLEGHLDNEKTLLITSDETYRNFEQSRKALEERQRQAAADQAQKKQSAHTPQVQEVLDKGNAFIQEIRRCNDRIPGKEISEKIDRMERIVRRIFQRAEANPDVVPDLKKMMGYYLPMTVKLLNAYAEMDAQGVQGGNIEASKREIEATLDTLNLAFEKLLDDLFADTALDVSSDISVLQTLLAQEGLTEDDFSKMKKQQNI